MIGRRIRAFFKADINPFSMTRRLLKLIEAGRLDEANDFLLEVERRTRDGQSVKDRREHALSRINRGFNLMRQCKWSEAEQLLTEIIEGAKVPPGEYLWAGRAQCRLKLGREEEAKSDLRMAMAATQSREPGDTLILDSRESTELLMGFVAKELGLWSDAVWAFERVLSNFPGDEIAHNRLAWLRSGAPDPDVRNGKLAIQHALLIQKDDWTKSGVLAAAYAECGDFDEAIRWAEKSLKEAPEDEKPTRRDRLAQYKRGEPFRIELKRKDQSEDD